jgi:hypothetical protein
MAAQTPELFFGKESPQNFRDLLESMCRKAESKLLAYFLHQDTEESDQELLILTTQKEQDFQRVKLFRLKKLSDIKTLTKWEQLKEFIENISSGCIEYYKGTFYAANAAGEVLSFSLNNTHIEQIGTFEGIAQKLLFMPEKNILELQVEGAGKQTGMSTKEFIL